MHNIFYKVREPRVGQNHTLPNSNGLLNKCREHISMHINAIKYSQNQKTNTLLFDFRMINMWAEIILSQENLVSDQDLPYIRKILESEVKKDSQKGYIDNTNKLFDENEVNKFLGSDIPQYDW